MRARPANRAKAKPRNQDAADGGQERALDQAWAEQRKQARREGAARTAGDVALKVLSVISDLWPWP